MNLTRRIATIAIMITTTSSCSAADRATPTAVTIQTNMASQVNEVPVQMIPLSGPAAKANAELSGLAWFGDWLILLPQYPARFSGGSEGALLALPRQDILSYLEGGSVEALQPRQVPLYAPGLFEQARGYEGFEALAIIDERIYLTIEANSGTGMLSYLVSGTIMPDLSEIRLESSTMRTIPAQARISNFSDEAITSNSGALYTIYESNGALYNINPVAHTFDLELNPLASAVFPPIEFRITDATPMEVDGTFWAINYFYPGDTKVKPSSDPLAARYGLGRTHAQFPQVERLVRFRYQNGSFLLVEQAPIQLELADASTARNWEGLAKLDNLGFLLVSDLHPSTLLAFVPFPDP